MTRLTYLNRFLRSPASIEHVLANDGNLARSCRLFNRTRLEKYITR